MRDRFTIVGGRGFIGRALGAALHERGADVVVVAHRDPLPLLSLGHVIYASGVASSAAADSSYAYGAHVEGVRRVLDGGRFDSLLFLSSTRVYGASLDTSEGAALSVAPEPGRDVYRVTKIAGETLCLAHPSPNVRVARLSNVAGPSFESPLFLSDVLRQAATTGRAVFHTTRESSKDYLTAGEVCRYLLAIASGGAARLYNVAQGENVENGAICDALAARGVTIEVAPGAARAVTPPIDVRRLRAEFGAPRETLRDVLAALFDLFSANAAAPIV